MGPSSRRGYSQGVELEFPCPRSPHIVRTELVQILTNLIIVNRQADIWSPLYTEIGRNRSPTSIQWGHPLPPQLWTLRLGGHHWGFLKQLREKGRGSPSYQGDQRDPSYGGLVRLTGDGHCLTDGIKLGLKYTKSGYQIYPTVTLSN